MTRSNPSFRLLLVTASLGVGSLAACADDAVGDGPVDPGVDAGGESADAGPDAACVAGPPEVVTFDTVDEVTLEADLVSAGVSGGPGVVLLHMIPPFNDRTGYPSSFLLALRDAGITVVNVDRRGAGGSGGVARRAYEGPNGKWDVRAAVDALRSHPCAIDPARIAVVGASNGTTSALDYAVWAASDAASPAPAAIAFLSGGLYTENQQSMADARPAIAATPMVFAYPVAEATWNDTQAADAPDAWRFEAYDPGAHGTGLFQSDPDVADALVAFLTASLGAE